MVAQGKKSSDQKKKIRVYPVGIISVLSVQNFIQFLFKYLSMD